MKAVSRKKNNPIKKIKKFLQKGKKVIFLDRFTLLVE
jgi:hypothetical protein